ncbi:MAG: hypothetical protein OXI16_10330 [Chloroflexota bacterium]|nr:hypothetical protein [Chloroflexota bacterium]
MISQLERPTKEHAAHSDFAESLKQAVIEQTDNGRRIIQSVTSIMEGDAPNCTPWHRLEAAKLLHKLGLGNTPTANHKPPLRAGENWGAGTHNIPSPLMTEEPAPSESWGQDGGEDSPPSLSDEQTKFNNKLIRHIRVDTGDGASIVKYLVEIMEGEDASTKGRDRLEAIKMLLGICLNSPSFPDAEFMMQAVRCHPDCFCVCENLPEDHPQVVKMHTPLTEEQRQRLAEQQAQQEEWDRRTDEVIERKKRADKEWKLEQFHSPEAKADRRIEREEQRKRRQQKREQEKQRNQELRERISRESRFDTWRYNQQQQDRQDQERARSP